ncbi:hypothetical protein BPLS_P4000 [Bathymodiolus platifrons methanotrophic gill symbiont]|nr:hypothetical protein BPLS_P4000 [Bathymodiolus platifrons methanotrophic gill symbiont]
MIKSVFIGIAMIKQLVNNKILLYIIIPFFSGWSAVAYSTEMGNFSNATHQYSSYAEFASSVCLPCHYQNIPNGTDLRKLFPNPSEAELKSILLPILKDGNMPPNELYREILYNKFY